MMKLSCHCGTVRIEVAARSDYVNECNCSLCSKSGARWGYFHPSQVAVEGPTTGYCRGDKDEPGAEVHFCPKCGSTTHFRLTPNTVAKHGDGLMGVNMGLADAADLAGLELRFPDGRAWQGDGGFEYVREAVVLGGAAD